MKKKTMSYTVLPIGEGVWEIGEFDNASMFLIAGERRALLIDAGMGIGDIRGALARLTGKPVTLALTHNHIDHVGHAPAFGEAYVSEADLPGVATGGGIGMEREKRVRDIGFISQRSGLTYDYDLDVDLDDWDPSSLRLIPMGDGHSFDLGGRVVTAYLCPGHTKGSMVFLDDVSRILFFGDALNCNLGLYATSIEKALGGLERIQAMGDRYDAFYNGHYDYRACGEPLDPDVLPQAIEGCRRLVSGHYETTLVPSPLPIFPDRQMMVVGRAMIGFSPENILEPK